MADLFGAPLGDIAYHKDALTRMQTAAVAADTSLTPSRRRLLEAQAGAAETLATGRRAESAALTTSSAWYAAYRKDKEQERLEAMAIMQPLTTGSQMTVADLPDDEYAPEDPQLEYASWLKASGAPYALWGPIQDQGIENSRKGAMIYYREAQAEKLTTENEIKRDKQLAEMAHDAITSPLIWMNIVQDPKLISQLPPQMRGMSHEQAIPNLKAIAKGATSKVEEQKAALADNKDVRAKTLAGQTGLYYKSMKARTDAQTEILEDTLERIQKFDGYNSQTARDTAEALVKSKKLQILMDRVAVANPMPTSIDELLIETAEGIAIPYMSRDAKIFAYFKGLDEEGVPIWDPVTPSAIDRLVQEAAGEEDLDPLNGLVPED